MQTHRQHGDFISLLLLLFQNKERGLKIQFVFFIRHNYGRFNYVEYDWRGIQHPEI
jgi:hypothetical protein